MIDIPDIALVPVEQWEFDKVLPYPENHKIHSPKQVEALAKSIKSQGLNDPITVDADGYIISGHGRYEAMKKLGYKFCPVRHLKMLTKEQADKLRIAANRTSSSEYDFDALQRELNRLGGLGFELDDMGIDDRELDMLVGEVGELDSDSVSDDILGDVDAFEDEVREEAEEVREEEIPIAKAFNVKKLPLTAKKLATRFMGVIEDATGLEGAEALLAHMSEVVDG